jgi:hypothetical protein
VADDTGTFYLDKNSCLPVDDFGGVPGMPFIPRLILLAFSGHLRTQERGFPPRNLIWMMDGSKSVPYPKTGPGHSADESTKASTSLSNGISRMVSYVVAKGGRNS